ncbi:MAG: hypothetical protein JSS27_19630 [Planctomycetes bacterium]|nr:hypothetical protein [Planctomycetota bacterium]
MRASRYLAVALLSVLGLATLRGDEPPGLLSTPVPDRATLEKNFVEMLNGSSLVGHFTTDGKEGQPGKTEKYTLVKVAKVRDDFFLFQARIQYGKTDATLPLTLEVKWAGDTPVLTMTDFPVPGMGKFTCRILFFRDQYAGTWSGGDHGGQMFGKVVRASAAK